MKIEVNAGRCGCGCGEEVAKGRTFRMGHDARLKGALIRAHRAGEEVTVVRDGLTATGTAAKFADERGWGHFLAATPPKRTAAAG